MRKLIGTMNLPFIVVSPLDNEAAPFVATLFRLEHFGKYSWLAMGKGAHVDAVLASRMLALLCLHPMHSLIHPILIPTAPAPAVAFFLANGYWADHRNLGLPPAVRAEVERIAQTLRADQADFIADFAAALRGQRPERFATVASDLGVADPDGNVSMITEIPDVIVDEEALGKWGTPELQMELVAMDYRRERYLEQTPLPELIKRGGAALINMFELEGPGHSVADLSDAAVLRAIARVSEVHEELKLRGEPIPPSWGPSLGMEWEPDRARRATKWAKSSSTLPKGTVVRFGKAQHLQAMFDRGVVRLGAASGYADESLNQAQRADELALKHYIDVKRNRFELWDETRTKKLGEFEPIRPTVTRNAASDVLVLCLSRRISGRMFHAFEADGCLVIRDEMEFKKRLVEASSSALVGWEMMAGDVAYLDSYSPESRDATALFTKPAEFEYQKEHRILWMPEKPSWNLEAHLLELGPLGDIAHLLWIDRD